MRMTLLALAALLASSSALADTLIVGKLLQGHV